QVYRSFRPGDVVMAEVISLGDARSYYLSTARNELGVIFAESEAGTSTKDKLLVTLIGRVSHIGIRSCLAGETMVPISWQEMMCPKTKTKEFRKCAKPAHLP